LPYHLLGDASEKEMSECRAIAAVRRHDDKVGFQFRRCGNDNLGRPPDPDHDGFADRAWNLFVRYLFEFRSRFILP
jgi:hypothetical protein